jgi:hypothetical protein
VAVSDLRTVELLADARDHISEYIRYGEGFEAGGICFGYVERDKVVISSIAANTFEPVSPHHNVVDVELARNLDREDRRWIGSIHSHEYYSEHIRASSADRETWSHFARTLKQPYVGVVIAPRGVRWSGGYPEPDWVAPVLKAWLALPDGTVRERPLIEEPRWLADLEKTVRFAPRKETHHAA